jgi:hypothetical protein
MWFAPSAPEPAAPGRPRGAPYEPGNRRWTWGSSFTFGSRAIFRWRSGAAAMRNFVLLAVRMEKTQGAAATPDLRAVASLQ